ncbi:VPA1262 family N-terminal domain-containing protein [Acinetobacter baumannii]
MFQSKPNCNHVFKLFFYQENKDSLLLVYGIIFPANHLSNKNWIRRDLSVNKLLVIEGVFNGDEIKILFNHLEAKESLEVACENANISLPENKNFSDKIRKYSFDIDKYIKRIGMIYSSDSDELLRSPTSNSIAYVDSYFFVDKKRILDIDEDVINYLEKNILNVKLKSNINGSRLGNVEWFNFTSSDIYSNLLYDFSSRDNVLKVEIFEEGVFLINIRILCSNTISVDELFDYDRSVNAILSVRPLEKIDSYELKIWKIEEGRKIFWAERKVIPMRRFVTSVGISNGEETSNLNKINENINKKLNNRVISLGKYFPFTPVTRSVHGEAQHKIEEVIESTYSYMLKKYPKESNSIFLPKGFEGKLEFYEWFKNQINLRNNDVNEIIIVDPYLEDIIFDLLTLIENLKIKLTLILCSNLAKNKTLRIQNIKKRANKFLNKKKSDMLKIYDVENESRLHDRYMLFVDQDHTCIRGYHLSNSIQKANENYPLLITEIPKDTCYKIQDWLLSDLNEFLNEIKAIDEVKEKHNLEKKIDLPFPVCEEFVIDNYFEYPKFISDLVWESNVKEECIKKVYIESNYSQIENLIDYLPNYNQLESKLEAIFYELGRIVIEDRFYDYLNCEIPYLPNYKSSPIQIYAIRSIFEKCKNLLPKLFFSFKKNKSINGLLLILKEFEFFNDFDKEKALELVELLNPNEHKILIAQIIKSYSRDIYKNKDIVEPIVFRLSNLDIFLYYVYCLKKSRKSQTNIFYRENSISIFEGEEINYIFHNLVHYCSGISFDEKMIRLFFNEMGGISNGQISEPKTPSFMSVTLKNFFIPLVGSGMIDKNILLLALLNILDDRINYLVSSSFVCDNFMIDGFVDFMCIFDDLQNNMISEITKKINSSCDILDNIFLRDSDYCLFNKESKKACYLIAILSLFCKQVNNERIEKYVHYKLIFLYENDIFNSISDKNLKSLLQSKIE